MLEAGLIASRFLHYVAVLSLFGAALYPLYVVREGFASAQGSQVAWLRRILLVSLIAAVASGLAWFEFTTATMADSAEAMMKPGVLMSMMTGTDFGPLWAARFALAAMVAVLLPRWPARISAYLMPVFAALLLASLAGTGHARIAEGWAGTLHVANDAVHLLAGGFWIGGLWPLGRVLRSSFEGTTSDPLPIAETLRRFSAVATLGVAILVISGLINSWFLVGSIGALFSTRYGWLLTAKIALFAVMALLAGINRFWITPRLTSHALLGRLRRNVLAEQMLGLSVLALVAVLGTLEPSV